MSFILQRIVSGNRISSQHSLPRTKQQIYAYQAPTIANAKQLSETEWKIIIFKSMRCFTNAMLILVSYVAGKCSEQEEVYELLHISFMLACCSAIFFLFGVLNQHKIEQEQAAGGYERSISRSVKNLVLFSFFLIHPNYFLKNTTFCFLGQQYTFNSIASVLVNFRIFSMVIFVVQISRFYGLRVSRLLQIFAVKDNRFSVKFAIKCLFKQNSLRTCLLVLSFGLVILSFIDSNIKNIQGGSVNYLQELYTIVITMTTVGYGDLQISDSISRACTVAVIIFGSFVSSMLTVTVLNFFKLSEKEVKAHTILRRLGGRGQIEKEEKKIVSEFLAGQIKNRGAKSKQYYKELIGLTLKKKKQKLHGYERNQTFVQFLGKHNTEFNQGIKKLVEKQLILKNMMNFYFQRKSKIEQQLQQQEMNPLIAGKPRKRVQDSQLIMKYHSMIVSDS